MANFRETCLEFKYQSSAIGKSTVLGSAKVGFDEICNLHCCLWNLISESVTQREGSCNKSGVISFVLRLYCGVD